MLPAAGENLRSTSAATAKIVLTLARDLLTVAYSCPYRSPIFAGGPASGGKIAKS
jgi:hypothetical protein